MSYTPKIHQKSNPDLKGGALFLENGRPYQGPYLQDVTGDYYTGEYLSSDSKLLILVFPEGNLELLPEENFIVHYPKITEETRKRGYLERYFLQHPVTGRIKEVSEEGFKRERRLYKAPPYIFYQCTWYLKEDLVKRNEKSIEEGEKVMKRIRNQVLKSPLQFVE